MMMLNAMKFAVMGIGFLLGVGVAFGARPKSHTDCIKRVPGDWGPNFGEQWHHNEALYWGCRLGVSSETVAAWQKAADLGGMVHHISVAVVQGQKLMVIEELSGSAHCFDDGCWRWLESCLATTDRFELNGLLHISLPSRQDKAIRTDSRG